MRLLKIAALLLGVSLLYFIIRKIGVEPLRLGFSVLGWRLLIPVAIVLPAHLLFTLSWRLFLKRFQNYSVPFWKLFRIKVAGEAANTLTPLNFVGGDPVRIWLLSKNFPVEIGGASVVVDRTLQILAVVSLIFLGNVASLFHLHLPTYARVLLGVSATLLLIFILLFLFQQTKGFFQKLARWIQKIKIRKFSENTLKIIEDLDHYVGEFYKQDKPLFFVCFFLHLIARVLSGVFEIYVLAHLLGVPMSLWDAVFFAAVIPLTNLIGGIVPGTLGVMEGVVSSLFMALHWNPADGLILQIARRLRASLWIVVGLVFIFFFKSEDKRGVEKVVPSAQK